jgi:hypothetical protein
LKIERDSQGGQTTIRLIGHFQSEHVGELKKQLQHNGPLFILDLKEVRFGESEGCAECPVQWDTFQAFVEVPFYKTDWSHKFQQEDN